MCLMISVKIAEAYPSQTLFLACQSNSCRVISLKKVAIIKVNVLRFNPH
jgi:hypothetical protein